MVSQSSRISSVDLDPSPKPAKGKRKPAVKARLKSEIKADNAKSLRRWATAGVVLMSGLSAMCNGLAFSEKATYPLLGWALGLAIVGIIYILGHVAAGCFKAGNTRKAQWIGAIGSFVLFLSVWHGATSIAALTGSPLPLALMMAIGIDAGFIACEIVAATTC